VRKRATLYAKKPDTHHEGLTNRLAAVNVYCMRSGARADTRALLLEAAAIEFAKHGLAGTSVREIVKRARINERMIYHHFESKEGLYRAVLLDQWAAMARAWRPGLEAARELPPREGLQRALTALFEVVFARPLTLPLVVHEALGGWQMVPDATLQDVPSELRELFARGRSSGLFRKEVDFELFYTSALGALMAVTVFSRRFKDTRERSRKDPRFAAKLAERMLGLLFDGVVAPGRNK
jgi:TetR/AcrR family transcriptional regulator